MEPYEDRKSTRLNSSHSQISYAVFCLKKKKKKNTRRDARPAPHEVSAARAALPRLPPRRPPPLSPHVFLTPLRPFFSFFFFKTPRPPLHLPPSPPPLPFPP